MGSPSLSGVLDKDESDVLVNVNIVDREKANKNVELKKKRPEYKPYEEQESVDDMVVVSMQFTWSSSAWHLRDA